MEFMAYDNLVNGSCFRFEKELYRYNHKPCGKAYNGIQINTVRKKFNKID